MFSRHLNLLNRLRRWVDMIILCLLVGLILFLIPIGWIGEVTSMWGPIPLTTEPEPLSCFGDVCLHATRPILRWRNFPLMLNVYTPAWPDWIGWFMYRLVESPISIRISQVFCTTICLAILLRLTKGTLSSNSQTFFILFLLTDWNFMVYKRALGNTEIVLQLALLLCCIPFLSHSKRAHAQWVYWGILLGLWAKITFVLCLPPLLYLWYTNNKNILDWRKVLGTVLIGLLPTLLMFYWTLQIDIPVRSHDFWTLQWERIRYAIEGGSSNVREQSGNFWIWLLDPLQFFSLAYGVGDILWHGWGRLVGFGLTTFAALYSTQTRSTIRLVVLLGLQASLLTWIAQDLHHLVIATPLLWLVTVHIWQETHLSTVWRSLAYSCIFASHLWIFADANQVINSVSTPTFSTERQQHLLSLLQKHHVQQVTTMDYEVMGVLEVLDPTLPVIHAWPSISTQRWAALPDIIKQTAPYLLLVLESRMPMTYNLRTPEKRLVDTAQRYGFSATLIEQQPGIDLYQITPLD